MFWCCAANCNSLWNIIGGFRGASHLRWAVLTNARQSLRILSAYIGRRTISLKSFNTTSSVILSLMLLMTCQLFETTYKNCITIIKKMDVEGTCTRYTFLKVLNSFGVDLSTLILIKIQTLSSGFQEHSIIFPENEDNSDSSAKHSYGQKITN